MFATTFVAYIALDTGHTQFSSGGHNPALVYHAASQQCEYLDTSGVAIGIFDTAEFDLETVQLDVGDILVLYTDGITEAINQDEDEFGEERLEQLVAENANLPAQHLADRILEAVNEFADEQNLFDDATLLVLKRVYATS